MRKRIVGSASGAPSATASRWLDLDLHAEVEVTSEDPEHPIESALVADGGGGWRAGEGGVQTIRLRFDEPRRVEHIRVVFDERNAGRTQEFVLRWSAAAGDRDREIVRQQYTFSPSSTTREVEDYTVELDDVAAIELEIVPDIGGGPARASLAELRLM